MSKRTQILIATETILAKHGFNGFSMQNLADMAGIATGTIYLYFKNKEMLMTELYQFIHQEEANNIFSGWLESNTPKQKYDLMWENAFNAVLANPQRLSVIEILHFVPNENRKDLALFENGAFKRLADFYKLGIKEQYFLNWQLSALVTVSFDTAINLAKKVIRERLVPDQAQLDQVREASWTIIQNPHFKSTGLTQ